MKLQNQPNVTRAAEKGEHVQTAEACSGVYGSIWSLPSLTWFEDTVSIVISPSNDLCSEAPEQLMVICFVKVV
jgi:hypothetical protein